MTHFEKALINETKSAIPTERAASLSVTPCYSNVPVHAQLMAHSFSPPSVSLAHCSGPHRKAHRSLLLGTPAAALVLVPLVGSFSDCPGQWTRSIAKSRQYSILLQSASYRRTVRCNQNYNCSARFGQATAAGLQQQQQKKQDPFRALSGSSVQGGTTAEEPDTGDNRRQGPPLQWVLLSACVVAAAAAAGVIIFLRLQEGRGPSPAGSAFLPRVAASEEAAARFTVTLPGVGPLSLGGATPGWVYFLLLMAAGFGLFVSEEALNVWVGASLGRLFDYGSREALWASLSANSPYVISTIVWVYWGVCISDMVPFFAGRLASKRGGELSQKQRTFTSMEALALFWLYAPVELGVSKKKYEQVTDNVRRYGNLIGFVERFSLGVRNPTSFLAGVAGISPEKYFGGVCLGGLFTLPMQMSVGFLLRERPVAALAGVATVVGAWTLFPVIAAGTVSLYYLLRRVMEKPSQ